MKPGEVVVTATDHSGVTYKATTQLRPDGSFAFNSAFPVGESHSTDSLFTMLYKALGRKRNA